MLYSLRLCKNMSHLCGVSQHNLKWFKWAVCFKCFFFLFSNQVFEEHILTYNLCVLLENDNMIHILKLKNEIEMNTKWGRKNTDYFHYIFQNWIKSVNEMVQCFYCLYVFERSIDNGLIFPYK